MTTDRSVPRVLVSTLLVMLTGGLGAQANTPRPTHSVVISGYGTAGWMKSEGMPSGFSTSVSPVLLFQMGNRVFAEAELEFGLEDGVTETALEYATVHYLANDNLTLSAGKFIVPFGVFAQRLHPSWINRFTSMPPIFGHHGGITGSDPLLPIVADVGVMASYVAPLGGIGRSVTASGFVTNGPQVGAAGHGAEEMPEDEHGGRPDFVFGGASTDNNANKMVGGRLGLVLAPQFEVDASILSARWGTADDTGAALGITGYNLAAEYRPSGNLELRTEWMWLRTEVEEMHEGEEVVETLPQFGGYVQAAYRRGDWEPVVRFALVDQDQNASAGEGRMRQFGVGLNYWLSPSVAVMAAFESNRDKFDAGADLANNRFLIHWAFGF